MKFNELRQRIRRPLFTLDDLRLEKLPVFSYQLSLWQKKGYIEQLKRGIYAFVERKEELSSNEVSFVLYQPSYISLETALSHYGLIPEIVHATTALTAKTNRKFENYLGNFIYRHIQPAYFFGYIPLDTKYGKYLLAEPEKALLDYLYLNSGRINNPLNVEELRFNCQIFQEIINKDKLFLYLKVFNNKKLTKIVKLLFKQCLPSNN